MQDINSILDLGDSAAPFNIPSTYFNNTPFVNTEEVIDLESITTTETTSNANTDLTDNANDPISIDDALRESEPYLVYDALI